MDMQKECLEKAFTYEQSAATDTEELLIPHFILQPIVENAIKHGFTDNTPDDHIEIRTYSEDEKLIISVRDNGRGMEFEKSMHILSGRTKQKGYGIWNVNEKIKVSCGADYGMEYIPQKSGTKVIITLPKIKQSGDECNV